MFLVFIKKIHVFFPAHTNFIWITLFLLHWIDEIKFVNFFFFFMEILIDLGLTKI